MFLIISILINFGLNIPMIRYFGAVGAAIASSISNIVLLVLLVLFSRKVIDYFAFLRLFWKKIISGSAMFLIILLLNLAIISFTNDRFIIVIFDVLVGAISYFTLCILLKESVMTSIIGMIKKKGDDKNE